jgi:hypothetical protein
VSIEKSGLTAYAVSTAVGSGKTRAAIQYMADPANVRQNFIYVAPTIRLIAQTSAGLREAIEANGSARDVALIHSQSRRDEDLPVAAETTETINAASCNEGMVVIITTTTFLRILLQIQAPQHWRVIVDEGFSPVQFLKVHLGARANEGLDHFLSVFAIQPGGHQVVPASGQAHWVEELAAGVLRRAGEKYATLQPLAAAVSNPVMRCELVMTPRTHAILARTYVAGINEQQEEATPRVAAESILLVASYVTPEPFAAFGEVVFMSALFEQTLLCRMWTTMFGVTFMEHPAFPKAGLRNIHADQGRHVEVGHLLHPEDRSSKYNLERNIHTALPSEQVPGQRVIDHLVRLSAEYFKDSRFLLQTNNGYGYSKGSPSMPSNATGIPALSHGLNEFQDHDNVAALAITNPEPAQTRWIMDKTGLDKDQTNMAFRIHTTYQAVGRSSIRKAEPTSVRKVFLTVGYTDAQLLHDIFEGSRWLGQVGDMKCLATSTARPPALECQLADDILGFLEGVPEDASSVSSTSIKKALNPTCGPSTWTRAVARASEYCDDWAMVGQSFIRKDAAYYGFEDESEDMILNVGVTG